MSFFSRIKTPVFQNTGSTARDHLASERTFLAWIRTGLGFIALGIAVERFSQLDLESMVRRLRPELNAGEDGDGVDSEGDSSIKHAKEHALVGALLGTGSGSIVYGTSRYFTNLRLIEQGAFKPAYHGVAVLSIAVAGMAGASYWSTLSREEQKHEHREEWKHETEQRQRQRQRQKTRTTET